MLEEAQFIILKQPQLIPSTCERGMRGCPAIQCYPLIIRVHVFKTILKNFYILFYLCKVTKNVN